MHLTRSWIVDGKFHDFYADLMTSAQYHEKKGKDLGLLRTNLVLQTDNPAGRGSGMGRHRSPRMSGPTTSERWRRIWRMTSMRWGRS